SSIAMSVITLLADHHISFRSCASCTNQIDFFYFDTPGVHQDLHSFPTRRSSDLRALNGRFNTSITHAYSIESAIQGSTVQQECRDRKSGSAGMPRPISYAVFCLKKKN